MATQIAAPPSVGVGFGWTFRSEGRSMAPNRTARYRTTGVATAAAAAVTRRIVRYATTYG
jgi:hypothetical protein